MADTSPTILVSPAEPPIFKLLGTVSVMTERMGVDFLWSNAFDQWCGVQRKALPDLIASLQNDDRLVREFIQVQELAMRVLIIEGYPKWGTNGLLLDSYSKWTRHQHHNLIQSLGQAGIVVHATADQSDTMQTIQGLAAWSNKSGHSSLLHRPNLLSKVWGSHTSEQWAIFFLQGLPDVGPTLAARIYQHFGTIPVAWTCTLDEIMAIKGIGKESGPRIYAALQSVASSAKDELSMPSPMPSPDSLSVSAPSTTTRTPTSKGSRKRARKEVPVD